MARVLIGIQARSGSTRLPRKAFELIAGRTMLDRVVDTCRYAAGQIEKSGHRCDVAVLTPHGDPIVAEFSSRVDIVEGPETDVLARYVCGLVAFPAVDTVVRITGDCPLIPGSLITYMTVTAIQKGYDYYSNSDERFRTSIDGSDCEVMTRRALEHADEEAESPYDREHVTPFIRRESPPWLRKALAFNNFDMSDVKLSVDTRDDLERVRRAYEQSFVKYQEAVKVYGRGAIHRL